MRYNGLIDKGNLLIFFKMLESHKCDAILYANYNEEIKISARSDWFRMVIGNKLDNTDKILLENMNHYLQKESEYYLVTRPSDMSYVTEYSQCKYHELKIPTFQKLMGDEINDKVYKIRDKIVMIIPIDKLTYLDKSIMSNYVYEGAKSSLSVLMKSFNSSELTYEKLTSQE